MNRSKTTVRNDYIAEHLLEPGTVMQPARLPAWQRVTRHDAIRRAFILLILALVWELYARWLNNSLMVPTLSSIIAALVHSIGNGVLPHRMLNSLVMLLEGYAIGVVSAIVLTTLAITTRFGSDLLTTLTAMFNPLPAIALLPLALLWFGLGNGSMLFVVAHSVLWPLALNVHAGYKGVSETLRMAGRNPGLKPVSYVARVLFPAAMPAVISGLKVSLAFGWRTLIAAELVFGASSSGGGIGWFIFEKRNDLEIPDVFAGLLVIVFIGLAVEGFVFRELESRTVHRWGMVRG